VSEFTQGSDLDDDVEDGDQSTSTEDQSDGSWEDEEWGGLSGNDGSEARGSDDFVDDYEMTETKEGQPSDAQPKTAGQFSYMHIFLGWNTSFSQDVISRRD
jgi:nucleolar MIF4G domain-containing protein 1